MQDKAGKEAKDSSSPIVIPISVLADRSVATLEAIVEYLKEVRDLSYHEIAILLKRNDRTIWTCYHRAKQKREHEKAT